MWLDSALTFTNLFLVLSTLIQQRFAHPCVYPLKLKPSYCLLSESAVSFQSFISGFSRCNRTLHLPLVVALDDISINSLFSAMLGVLLSIQFPSPCSSTS